MRARSVAAASMQRKVIYHEIHAKLEMVEIKLEKIQGVRHQLETMASSETDAGSIEELKAQSAMLEQRVDAINAIIDDLRCKLEENAVIADSVNEKIFSVEAIIKIEQSKLDHIFASS